MYLSQREKQMLRNADVNTRIRMRCHKAQVPFDRKPKGVRNCGFNRLFGLS